jgi:hypothetical protein
MKKLALICALLLGAIPAQASERLAVVELFTSQGCSSCPPADEFLGELAMRKDVLALAYHVDYWDYIGWDDVHAKAAYTQRQRLYAQAFDLRYVYTPQMVVSGKYETSGNSRRSVIRAVEKELSVPSEVILREENGQVFVDGERQDTPVHVIRVSYLKEVSTKVKRGENRGKTLKDYHIVSDMASLGTWDGGEAAFTLDSLPSDMGHGVFLQRQDNLKILGAIRLN